MSTRQTRPNAQGAPGNTAGRRTRLSRERVLSAAIALADANGIEALTMRALARDLGVEAMTLYYWFANKDEILYGILDSVVAEMELPGTADWRASIASAAASAHRVLKQHPWAAGLLLAGSRVSTARLKQMEAILACLRSAGFSAQLTDQAYHALDSHIMGFTLWEVGISAGLKHLGRIDDFAGTLDAAEFPYMLEHIEQHRRPRQPGEPSAFTFGLDLILDGLERLLQESRERAGDQQATSTPRTTGARPYGGG